MHAPSRLRPLLAVAAVSLAVLGLAACGDDDDKTSSADTSSTVPDDGYGNTTTTANDTGDADKAASTVVAKDFSLTSITVTSGEDVYFDNQGSAPHTMTADDGTSFTTGTIQGGEDAEFAAPAPGVYPFHCEIHPAKMKGTLTVE